MDPWKTAKLQFSMKSILFSIIKKMFFLVCTDWFGYILEPHNNGLNVKSIAIVQNCKLESIWAHWYVSQYTLLFTAENMILCPWFGFLLKTIHLNQCPPPKKKIKIDICGHIKIINFIASFQVKALKVQMCVHYFPYIPLPAEYSVKC